EDLGRLVATNAHRNRFTNPFETQISNRGSPEIVNLQTLIGSVSAICRALSESAESGFHTGALPSFAEATDGKQQASSTCFRNRLQPIVHGTCEWNCSRRLVFRLQTFHSDHSRRPIDLIPTQLLRLADSATGSIKEQRDGPQTLGQMVIQ